MRLIITFIFASLFCFFNTVVHGAQAVSREKWNDAAAWVTSNDGKSAIEVSPAETPKGKGLVIRYGLKGDYGWVQWNYELSDNFLAETIPLKFSIKSEGTGDFEMKFIDEDGSNFGRKQNLKNQYNNWKDIVLLKKSLEYWWGGNQNFDGLKEVSFAVSGKGSGVLYMSDIGLGTEDMSATFPPAGPQLDPDRKLPGIGFRQRRADSLIPEDPLVLEWLKQVQDNCSVDKQVLPSSMGPLKKGRKNIIKSPSDFYLEGFYIENQLQTFNNSLAAMAFMVKGEKERAERILDFYAQATDKNNRCIYLQNFFYKGRPMGFYQYVTLYRENGFPEYHNPGPTERWIGDMAWLLMAYKQYEKKYSSDRYNEIAGLLKGLLVSYYKDDPQGQGGYIQHLKPHDWEQKNFEPWGHTEGNIDCYAVFKMCGEDELAAKIKTWLDAVLQGNNHPFDCYTWRALAFGKDYPEILDIPDYDFRFRKIMTVNGRKVMGFYHAADINVNNIWLDGTGHIACAYQALDDKQRGYFYANQYDPFIMEMTINGVKTKTLPYTANKEGIYDWVEPDLGLISVVAWYIFSKNGFNPMQLEQSN